MNASSSPSPFRRAGAIALAVAMLVQPVEQAQATVSQSPPLYTSPPDVNVMFTLDDSVSMLSDAIPDITDTTDMSEANPFDPVVIAVYFPRMWRRGALYRKTGFFHSGNGAVSTAVANQARVGRYLRSLAGNPIYYNPAVTYRPWPRPENDTLAYPNASVTAVNIASDSPFESSDTLDLETRVNINTADGATGAGDADNENNNYWPATYFVYRGPNTTTAPFVPGNPQQAANVPANFTKVEIKRSVPSYPKAATRTDCAGATTCSYAEEIQNFANWLQYYRSRRLMAKGGVASAFSKLGSNFRLGFASINSSPVVRKGVAPFSGANRTSFYNDLYTLGSPMPYGTPLRTATDAVGKYFERRDIGNPWAQDPTSTTTKGIEYSCRKSFHILSTDGYWSGAGAVAPASGNQDNFSGFTPQRANGARYAYGDTASAPGDDPLRNRFGIQPFADQHADTLADVAAYYWKTDLRPDLSNAVSPSARDPAFWQHLTTFTVGLGISGTGKVNRTAGGLAAMSTQTERDQLVAGRVGVQWPSIAPEHPNTGDDLLHASMNGRGAHFSASDPKALTEGLGSALAEALDQSVSSANLSNDSAVVMTDSLAFRATYNSYRWTGRLYGFRQAADGTFNTLATNAAWEASNKMPSPAARNIYTWNPTTRLGTRFAWTGLNATQRGHLGNDASLLDYLRGDGSKELQNGGSFRDRSRYPIGSVAGGVLGDIVNGSPLKGPTYGGGYDKLKSGEQGQSTYANYRSPLNAGLISSINAVYVGANDGMLHAFDANTGVERMAFVADAFFNVPRASGSAPEQRLKMLSDPAYLHRFTMDGPPQIGDAYLGVDSTLAGWKTVLVASTGVGARAVYALDVSDMRNYTANKVLWEFSETSAGGGDMGYVTKYPHIAKMRNGKWVAIFGNGYDSVNGQAKLFILDLKTGAVIWQQAVGPAGSNGLSQPNFTVNANREVETIYAGDVRGNLWKFDVNDANPAAWKVAFSGNPLFQANSSSAAPADFLPITTMPEISYHTGGGAMVSFGTGKMFETEDSVASYPPNVNLRTQRIYGIWDKPGETTGFTGLSMLMQRSVNSAGNGIQALPSSSSGTPKRGWYISLQSGGERVTVNPVQIKDVLFFVANKPVLPLDPCGSDGTSRVFGLNPMSGGAPTNFGVFNPTIGRNVLTVNSVISSPLFQVNQSPTSVPSSVVQLETHFNNRGQTGALSGGVQVVSPGVQRDCLGKAHFNARSGGIDSTDVAFCGPYKPRVSWRQIK